MFHTPAHKQTDKDKQPGQILPPPLEEYISQVMQEEFPKKKLTFDEWYLQSGWAARHQELLSLDDADSAKYIMNIAWNASKENV